ncbi:P-type conjugative transfer protein TrbL [Caulobacter sp. CCH5-E12]|uniref:P-type conjugative transfer protein TrbL n=1 Tax=Caulobacter sp. CCH5-E12 TaxID=1768770 RepID=UPI00078191C5|nr:P-type conjugative transfer protein TrbL [Caulobacter sp. CCH5-E12]
MQTASPAALDDFIARYTSQIGAGFGLIHGDVQTTFGALMVISLALAALLWAIDENQNVPAALIRKMLLFGFFAWLISSWHDLTLTIVKGFVALGLKAGGGRMSASDLMNAPSKIVVDGLSVAFELLKYIGRVASEGMGVGFFTHIDTILVTAIVIVGVILAFILLGVEVVVTVIEFYVVTLISFVMVPFGILTQTAFLAERAIAYVPSVGVKMMALALVVSIGEQIFTSYTLSAEPTWQESCGMLVAAIVLLMLALKIPAVAAAQITGSPQLSAGSAAASVVGIAATMGGAALAGRWLAGGTAQSAGAAMTAARQMRGGLPPAASSASGGKPGGGPSGGTPSGGSAGGAASGPSASPGDGEAGASEGGGTARPWSPRRWSGPAEQAPPAPPAGGPRLADPDDGAPA